MRYRDGLATTLASAAIPYGYSLLVWMSGALADEHHGTPRTRDILAFGAGAVGAYGLLRVATRGGETHPGAGLARDGLLRAGVIHLASLTLGTVGALFSTRVAGDWGWFLPPLVGTSIYLAGTGVAEMLQLTSGED